MSPLSPLLGQALSAVPWAVVDVETTGLAPERGDRVVEVAVLRAEPGGRMSGYSSLVHPGRPMDPRASAVNGIRDRDLAGAPSFEAIAADLGRHLEGAVLVAHNAPFDLGFLRSEHERAGLPWVEGPVIDTLGLARQCFRFPANNLGTVAQSLGVRPGQAHRARGDTETTLGILRAMLARLAPGGPTTVAEVILAARLGIGPADEPPPTMAEPLASAVREKRAIVIRYRSKGGMTVRVIEPQVLRGAYLVAYCHLRRESRTFHLERIREAWWPR